MGDSWLLNLKCKNCGRENENVYYQDDGDSFKCEYCGVVNKIYIEFLTK